MNQLATEVVEKAAELPAAEKVSLVVEVATGLGGKTADEAEHLLTSLRRQRELAERKAIALTREEVFTPLYEEFQ